MGYCARLSLVLVLGVVACIQPDDVACGDLTCPEGALCVGGSLCATPDQLTACNGVADGGPCTIHGAGGACEMSVCVATGCGNGVIDPGEVCDGDLGVSGNGQRCSADCKRIEECGNAVVDPGEQCDDGNNNPVDGCDACTLTAWVATVTAGGTDRATAVPITGPVAVAVDRNANLYIADSNGVIHRVDASGVITTVAGTGGRGFGGDGGLATGAQLDEPAGLAVDGRGNVFVADTSNQRVRRIDAASGIITTVAGNGTRGFSGDASLAISAELQYPSGVAVDGLGNLYIADTLNQRIRRVDAATGFITTVAGTGAFGSSGVGGPGTSTQLGFPQAVAVDDDGNVDIADTANQRILRLAIASGNVSLVAGGAPGYGGDGGPAIFAQLAQPMAVAVDGPGNVFIADTENAVIRRVDAVTGLISTVAGTGTESSSLDGGAATSAALGFPIAVAADHGGDFYVGDVDSNLVRRVDASTGIITTAAGTRTSSGSGDGGAATSAAVGPWGVALDAAGNVYIADSSSGRIRRVDITTDIITTFAGGGSGGDGGLATGAQLAGPWGIALDATGDLFIAEQNAHRVRRVDGTTGIITTIAGTGAAGFSGDTAAATSAQLSSPDGVAVDTQGNVFIADTGNNRIRRIDGTTGIITTVAGGGGGGDGGAANLAGLSTPRGVAVDGDGNIYIADSADHRIRLVTVGTGIITTVAGSSGGAGGDGGPATSAHLDFPFGVAVDANHNIFIADTYNSRVRRVDGTTGIITSVTGNGALGFSGDGDAATTGTVGYPYGVAFDAHDNIYIADEYWGNVRRVDAATGLILTFAGGVATPGTGPIAEAHLTDPLALVVAPTFMLVAAGVSGTIERVTTTAIDEVIGRYPQSLASGVLARFRDSSFGAVSGVAYDDAAGLIYLTESTANRVHVVAMVDPADVDTWTIAPLVNATGTAGFADGAAATAQLRNPTGLYLDTATQQLYVADTGNHVVRAIDLSAGTASATVRTIAGTGATLGFYGDGLAATDALLYAPQAVTLCANGDLMVADTGNDRVRRIAAGTNLISTVLGDGDASSSGDGTPASTFPVDAPRGLACDALGNLFVTSSTSVRLLPAAGDGVVDGTGDVQTIYGMPPRTTFPASATSCLTGVQIVDPQTIELTDACTGLLIKLVRGTAQ